jgi:hypothetical protein
MQGAERPHRHGTCERDQTLDGPGGSDDVARFHDGILGKLTLTQSGFGYDDADCK